MVASRSPGRLPFMFEVDIEACRTYERAERSAEKHRTALLFCKSANVVSENGIL